MRQSFSKAVLWMLGLALLGLGGALPARAQGEVICEPGPFNPYLFILLDTSGSMNWAPPCSQDEINWGHCSYLCTAPECYVLQQADSPDSKLYQVKAGLYDALSSTEAESVQLGFGSFNQDALNARSKHWLYQATASGVNIPGWGPFPAAGSLDVLGRVWNCDEGSGIDEAGCLPSNPADTSDAWELERVRTLAKGGETLTTAVTFYLRNAGIVYRVRYAPLGGVLGSATVNLRVRVERCQNASCTSVLNLGEPTLAYSRIAEYLVWDNDASRTEPIGYFSQSGAADTAATNTCAGWDPNTDTTSDRFSGYSLRWPTVTSDPRGSSFYEGDVLPLDWLVSHREDIQTRLAPNILFDPLGTPDFRTSPYLRDLRSGAESFLRLKNDLVRPLIANGSTPLGGALRSFRTWYPGWENVAAAEDPEFFCRQRNVVLITDGVETCGIDPCAEAQALYSIHGVRTFVVAFGMDPLNSAVLECAAANGGTGSAIYPRNQTELADALRAIFGAAGQP